MEQTQSAVPPGSISFGDGTPIMENQMEKKLENKMETLGNSRFKRCFYQVCATIRCHSWLGVVNPRLEIPLHPTGGG